MDLTPFISQGDVRLGNVEETAFRGYMQVPVEDRHGQIIGIGVAVIVFSLVHMPPLMIFLLFLLGSVSWGVLAWLADSTRPGMVAHATVDGAVLLWILWNPTAFRHLLKRSLASTGLDISLGITLLVAGLGLVITILMFMRLHDVRVKFRESFGAPGDI